VRRGLGAHRARAAGAVLHHHRWPDASPSRCAMIRASVSASPPGASGTMILIGLAG
jgi:hypothetical protein